MGIKMQGTSGAIVPKSLECAFLSLAIHSSLKSQLGADGILLVLCVREECAAPNTSCSGNWERIGRRQSIRSIVPRRPNRHFSIAIAMAIGLGLECCHE